MRAALGSIAGVAAFGGHSDGVAGLSLAEGTVAAASLAQLVLGTVGCGRASRLLLHTPAVWVARESARTTTGELARRVGAKRVHAALTAGPETGRALVDVETLAAGVSRVARRTGARVGAGGVVADGQLAALAEHSELPVALVDVLAVPVGVAAVATRTVAPVGARHVRTDGALAAQTGRAVVGVALIDVYAAELDVVWVEGEAWLADAGCLLAMRLTGGVLAAIDAVTGRLAPVSGVLLDGNEAIAAGALERAVGVEALAVLAAGIRLVALVDIATLTGGR